MQFIRSTCLLFSVGLFISPIGNSSAHWPEQAIPADLAAFLDKGRSLLAAGDNDGLKALSSTAEVLPWLGQRGRRTRSEWKLDALPFDASGSYVAVFHSFHTTESTGDHIHRLVKGPSGWRF